VIKSGVTLEMTPHIGEDGFITVDVQTEVSDVASRRNSSGSTSDGSSSDLPVIRRRKADTHVRVKEGDAIVIGGLIETQETTNHGKFPGLAEIPVVGGLFKSKADSTTKKEVMIFITPQIMKDNQVAFSDRNKMINGTEEVEKLRSPEFYAMEKDRNNKISQDEIQSLNQAVTMLDSGNNNQRNVNTVNNEMTPEQEKQMLQEAISLLAVDSDAGKENNKK
jgi:type II secretory pathway component GspD/PulD (secretin)